MQFRPLSLAAVSALVASGAWYSYRGEGTLATNGSVQSNRGLSSTAYQEASASPQAPISGEGPAQTTRKALVVDNDQIYTGSIVGDGPLSKDVDDSGRKIVEMMTPDQATERIRKTEESYIVDRGRGVVRYDLATLPSNDPIEDDHAEKIVEVPSSVAAADGETPSSDWMFWGVFDGHSGWTTSAKLRQVLISFVARELNSTYKAASAAAANGSPFPSAVAIDSAIKSAFTRLDDEICHESVAKLSKAPSKRLAAELLAPALSGACALLSFYDSSSKTLRVACTGDSRAILGRRNPQTGKWSATALSIDQTGSNPAEAERMRSEHPASEASNVIRNGRVLGNLEPTRAFGDAFYKWSKETQLKLKRNFFGRTPHQLLKTPPYVTAEPVITTTQIQPENGDFLVMATDGLWEMLTNDEVVGLVGQWIETQHKNSSASSSSSSWLPSFLTGKSSSTPLPVEKGGNTSKTGTAAEEPPIRQQQWGTDQLSESQYNQRFTVEDKNAASHLIRNALGGKDQDMVCALLTLPSPYSRRYRDDLTVEVVFFGEQPSTKSPSSGNVSINADATYGGHDPTMQQQQKADGNGDLKPKL